MESDSNIFRWKYFLRQAFVSSSAWTFFFMSGMVLGTPTVTIPQLRAAGNSTAYVSDEMASWISSAVGYSGMIWVIVLTSCSQRFGLKITGHIQALNAFAAFTVLYFSDSPLQVLICQLLQGSAVASQSSTVLQVLTEYTTPRYRGLFLTLKSATLFWGIWTVNAMGIYISYNYIGLLGIICSIYVFIVILIIPESPYWLVKNERYDECVAAHRWLKGNENHAEKELKALVTAQKDRKSSTKHKKTIIERIKGCAVILATPEIYKPIGLCCLLTCMYHMSGKLVLTVYSIDIIKRITGSESTAHIGMLILDGITVLGMYVGCVLAKMLKRRTLLLGATSLAAMFLFIMAAYLCCIRLALITENGYVSIALLIGFSLAISCGPLIMSSSICGELLPLRYRTFSMCVFSVFAKLVLGVFLKIGPYILKYLGTDGAFLFFSIGTTILILAAFKLLPETKDKTLLEIAEYFTKNQQKKSELD